LATGDPGWLVAPLGLDSLQININKHTKDQLKKAYCEASLPDHTKVEADAIERR
jgi:hypothetical protein